MANLMAKLPVGVQASVVRTLFSLPRPILRLFAGKPIRRDSQELALEMQVLLRLLKLTGFEFAGGTDLRICRRQHSEQAPIAQGPTIEPVAVRALSIPGDHGPINARLYTPIGLAEGSPLLIFYHGGGFVLCDLDTHDNACRFLAREANVRVLSVDYRLAPEHPFPAGADDSLTAFRWAAVHAESLGIDPEAIALGGDSAGGNLAVGVALQAALAGEPRPVFLLLFYPVTDLTRRTHSRELFGEGFFLTDRAMLRCEGYYLTNPELAADPRISILLAEDLSVLPPTYLATAGFDPLRDEGEEFGRRLLEAGVPVVLHRQSDLLHGYANFFLIGPRPLQAMAEAAGALRTGLALRSKRN